jgi:hypothetical protein
MAIYNDDYPVDRLSYRSERIRGMFERAGLRTVGQVRAAADDELLRWGNFGRVSLRELRSIVGTAAAPADHTGTWQVKDHASWEAERRGWIVSWEEQRGSWNPWFEFAF